MQQSKRIIRGVWNRPEDEDADHLNPTVFGKLSENFVPYQLCPKCLGQGIVSRPPYVTPDIKTWESSSTQTSWQCNVCNGTKIIPMFKVEK